jgi:hypothetical protein
MSHVCTLVEDERGLHACTVIALSKGMTTLRR